MLVQTSQPLRRLEGLLHGPPSPGHSHQHRQRNPSRCVAAEVAQLARAPVTPDQQPPMSGRLIGPIDQTDPGPVIEPVSLRSLARGQPLPRPFRQSGRHRVHAMGASRGPHLMITGDRQHIPHATFLQRGTQPRRGSVDLVPGHPTSPDTTIQRAKDHALGQHGLRREHRVLG